MNDVHRSKPQSQVKYLMLALIFALLAILSTRLFHLGITHYLFTVRFALGWLFWFFIVVSAICLLPIVNAVLVDLHAKGRLPSFLGVFYQARFQNYVVKSIVSIARAASSLIGQLFLLGVGILGLIILLSRVSAIDNNKVDGYVYEFISTLMKKNSTMSQSVLVEFDLPVGDCDSTEYLNRYRQILTTMKDVGVKVVLIDTRSTRGNLRTLATRLKDLDFVVFGLHYLNRGGIARTSYRGGMIGALSQVQHSSKGVYSVESEEVLQIRNVGQGPFTLEQMVYLDRIQLDGVDIGTGQIHDVALELFRKYKGIPPTSEVRREPGALILGGYKIPVTGEGWMYSRLRRNTWGWSFATSRKLAGSGSSTNELMSYNSARFKNKIVLIRETSEDMFSYGSGERLRYGHILTNLIEGNILRKLESGHIWLSALCLVCCVFIAQRFRPLITLLLILTLGFCTVFFAAYLYDNLNILIDVFYVILSMCFAIVAFPIVAMGHRIQARGLSTE